MTMKEANEENVGNMKPMNEQMEEALYGLFVAVIREFQRRLREEPGEIKASMFAQMLTMFKDNGISIENMSRNKMAQVLDEMDEELDWSDWEDLSGESIPMSLPPAEMPVPTKMAH